MQPLHLQNTAAFLFINTICLYMVEYLVKQIMCARVWFEDRRMMTAVLLGYRETMTVKHLALAFFLHFSPLCNSKSITKV